jgi:DNA-binding winged helix-turn-helix (wHTH) protein
LGGAGKSNFLRFLLRKNVRQQYLGPESNDFYSILVNFLSLVERTEWGTYELVLNSIIKGPHPPNWNSTIIDEISIRHQEIIKTRDALIAQRAFEYCVALMSQQSTGRLVFIFDEFAAVFRDVPASVFKCLRAIRDAYKDQISFIAVSAHDLTYLGDDLIEEVEHFHRLISRNICWLGPYSERDSQEMIRYLAARRSRVLREADTAHLIELSGGHAGLLKAILSFSWNHEKGFGLITDLQLLNEPPVRRECGKIWKSLSDYEQADLSSLTSGDPIPPEKLLHLTARGLVRNSEVDPVFFSPLFGAFIKEQAPMPIRGTYIDRSAHTVRIDGKRVESLTELEFEFLCYLYESRGRLCTKDDIVKHVYRQRYDNFQGGVTDEALQALISRLRQKVEPDRAHPKYIVTVRGAGYKFVVPSKS